MASCHNVTTVTVTVTIKVTVTVTVTVQVELLTHVWLAFECSDSYWSLTLVRQRRYQS
jgi:hypothetical protein